MDKLHKQVIRLQKREANKRRWAKERAELWHTCVFISWLMLFWLGHMATGWFRWLFCPKGWQGKVKDIDKGWEIHQYDRDSQEAADKVRELNDPEAIVMFVRRIHPIFLDNDLLYVYSPKYKVRIWNGAVKQL